MNHCKKLILIVLLLFVFNVNHWGQTPYRQYANDGILLNFHEIDNVDFRVFLLYSLSHNNQFDLIADDKPGLFYIIANDIEDKKSNEAFIDTFETFYINAYADFNLLSKTDIYALLPNWKSCVHPSYFTSTMMDIALRNSRSSNNRCINSIPICTSDELQFQAATTSQTADQLEGTTLQDGCIGSSFNPSWYHMRIQTSGQFIIHLEGHDPNNGTNRDIDFCIWGPFTDPTSPCVAQLTTDKIIDCCFSTSYSEDIYLGYQPSSHIHNTSHGTVYYHLPETGEYYILMITNYSQQPCVITSTKTEGSGPGSTDCNIYASQATVTLTAGDIWGDGTGYQMLLDADANAYGTTIPETGALSLNCSGNDAIYAEFEYKIPTNADGNCSTQNIVINNSVSIAIPSNTYDWCITNPTPNDRIWIASELGNVGGRSDDYLFESGKIYEFIVTRDENTGHDQTNVTIIDGDIINAYGNPTSGGIVSGGGTYIHGSTCTLQATPNYGYSFVKWTKDGNQVSTNANYSFTVTENASYMAHFQQSTTYYTITTNVTPAGTGNVTGGGTYAYGTTLNIQANANNGYTFSHWQDGNTQNPRTITVTGNATYTATFTQIQYQITTNVNPTGAGMVTGGGTYQQGQSCTVSASNNSGFTFTNWTENGNVVYTQANYTFTVNGDRNLVANFSNQPLVVGNDGPYCVGETIHLTANYVSGASYHWTGPNNYSSNMQNPVRPNCTMTMAGTYTCTITLNGQTTSASTEVVINPIPTADFTTNSPVYLGNPTQFTSTSTGQSIVSYQWNFGDGQSGTGQSISHIYAQSGNYQATLTVQTSGGCSDQTTKTVIVNSIPSYTITVSANPLVGGTVTGGGNYPHGTFHEVTATANEGYTFTNWTENGSIVHSNTSYTFTVDDNRDLVANFTANSMPTYTITVSANPPVGGTVTGGGNFAHGTSHEVTATANEGYTFTNWTENGQVILGADANYTFSVDSDRDLVAIFDELGTYYTISATAGDNGTISPEGDVHVEPGEDKTFDMTPYDGYSVSKVWVDGVDHGPLPSYTFRNVSGNHSIFVQFSGVGMDDAYDLELRIYPNPANDYIIVEGADMNEIILYDLLGIQQQQKEVNDNHVRIATDDLIAGTYILKVVCKDGRSGHLRFVVAR